MKRNDLIRQIEKLGCVFSATAGDTTGIKIQTTGPVNRFPATGKSRTTLPVTLSRS